MLVYGCGLNKKNGISDKAISVSVSCDDDLRDKYFIRITNHGQKLKSGHMLGKEVYSKFSVVNPELMYTLPSHTHGSARSKGIPYPN